MNTNIKIPLSEYSFAHNRSNEQYETAKKEVEAHGFDTTEVINMDTTIARFVLPRLKHFKAITKSYPSDLTESQWDKVLDKMIFAMEYFASDAKYDNTDLAIVAKAEEGALLLGKYFSSLWS
jgi:hypothetical protein